ncbi:hypothetical protein Trydic_g9557 [Trypoxylus dichotomus]
MRGLHWLQRFNSDDSDVNDKECDGAPKKFQNRELEELLDSHPCETLGELSALLDVDRSTVGKRFHALEMVQKAGNLVPHELKKRDIEGIWSRAKCCYNDKKEGISSLLEMKKWIHCDNPKRKLALSFTWLNGEVPSTSNRNIHGLKVMLSMFYNMRVYLL